jgi:predicted esterase YcpF (UPF0227 family)
MYMKIVYLHGFGSQGMSAKSDHLKTRFGEDQVEAPDLHMHHVDGGHYDLNS